MSFLLLTVEHLSEFTVGEDRGVPHSDQPFLVSFP